MQADEVPAVGEASLADDRCSAGAGGADRRGRLLDVGVLISGPRAVERPVLFPGLVCAATTADDLGPLRAFSSSPWSGSAGTRKAQLSVVNVLTFSNALLGDFSWSYFFMDPLVFVLWFAVAARLLLFWGRGAFCGWLCPFGHCRS